MTGFLIFGIAGLVLVAAFAVVLGRRRDYESTGGDADVLTDEEFRRIEFGDED